MEFHSTSTHNNDTQQRLKKYFCIFISILNKKKAKITNK